jgi:DNA repair exonuclease SbcCD ATPase subunit
MSSKILISRAEKLNKQFLEYKSLLEKHTGSRDMLSSMIKEENDKIAMFEKDIEKFDSVINLLQVVLDNTQGQVTQIERICSDAIQSVLNDPSMQFKIKIEKKKVATDTNFFIEDKNSGEIDVLHGEAGGTKNIISVALRLLFSELYHPKISGPIILDEAGGNISTDHQSSFGKFLKRFSNAVNRQIILITHHLPVIEEADCKISVSKKAGESVIN